MLRLGEFQLFDPRTAKEGVAQVQQAIKSGLNPADLALAEGLLADSTPQALAQLRRALQLNPYCHSAHRHSLGLEFLLGRHEDFQEHVRLFRVLYPDDPTPSFLEASLLSIHGKLPEAEALLETLRASCSPQVYQQLQAGLRAFANASAAFDLKVRLAANTGRVDPLEVFAARGTVFGFTGYDAGDSPLRVPQLPCVRQGLLAGNEALSQLAIPFIGNPRAAVDQIKASWQHHPEALVPALAGLVLDKRAANAADLLPLKAELFQLAADSASLLPKLPQLCRFLAAKDYLELAASAEPPPGAKEAVKQNLVRASEASDLSAPECRAWFDLAMELPDIETARAFVRQWEQVAKVDPTARRARIRVELAAGALGQALQQLNGLLAKEPGDEWATAQRNLTLEKIKTLAASATEKTNPKP